MAAIRLHRGRGRVEAGATLLEGPHVVAAAVAAGVDLTLLFATPDDRAGLDAARGAGTKVVVVDAGTLRRLGTTETPQSPIAVMPIPSDQAPPSGRVLVAWGVGDPGNCGTLIRIAAAFGYGFVAGPESAEVWSPKVLRSAAGAHFAVPLGRAADLGALRTGGRSIVATVARGGVAPGPLPPSAAILIGNEARGLPPEVAAAADIRITIPTSGAVESLNAAVAGAIVAYLGVATVSTNLSDP